MKLVLAAIAVLLALAVWQAKFNRSRSRRLKDVFAGRPMRSDDQLHDEFFSRTVTDPTIAGRVRRVLSEELDADLGQIEAQDDFSGNLRFLLAFDSMADVAIVEGLERAFKIKFTDEQASKLHTFSEIVEAVSEKADEA